MQMDTRVLARDPQGELKFGHLPTTELCCLIRNDSRLPAQLMVAMTARELESLIVILERCAEILRGSEPRLSAHVGVLYPRPLMVRVLAVHTPQVPPTVVFRMQQRDHMWDSLLPAQGLGPALDVLKSTLQAATQAAEPPLTGTLEDGRVGDFKLVKVEGISHCWGVWQEFVQLEEVAPGTRVRVTPVQVSPEIRTYLRLQVEDEVPVPAQSETAPAFLKACEQGASNDRLLAQGQVGQASGAHLTLLCELARTPPLDAFLLAKITLSTLLGSVVTGDLKGGHTLWLGRHPLDILNSGIKLIEQYQVGDQDFMLYQMMSAWFHSLNTDVKQGLTAVQGVMTALIKMCREEDPRLTPLVLRNWRLHLAELFEGKEVPAAALAPWEQAVQAYGRPVLPKVLCFPQPGPWVIESEDFGEQKTFIRPTDLEDPAPAEKRPFWKRLLGLR